MKTVDETRGLVFGVCLAVSGCCSMAGSAAMTRLAVRRLRGCPGIGDNNRSMMYQWLIVGLAVTDLTAMINTIFNLFAYPVDAPGGSLLSVGNAATCTANAFWAAALLLQGAMCNMCLAWYFFPSLAELDPGSAMGHGPNRLVYGILQSTGLYFVVLVHRILL